MTSIPLIYLIFISYLLAPTHIITWLFLIIMCSLIIFISYLFLIYCRKPHTYLTFAHNYLIFPHNYESDHHIYFLVTTPKHILTWLLRIIMCVIIIQYPQFPHNYLTGIVSTPVCMLSITIINSLNYYVCYQVIVFLPGYGNYHPGLMIWNMYLQCLLYSSLSSFSLFPTTYLLRFFTFPLLDCKSSFHQCFIGILLIILWLCHSCYL
jgi:hypothetical protein